MKKIPSLSVVTSKQEFATPAVRKHFSNALANCVDNKDAPMRGYALVTFHDGGSYACNYHISEIGINQVDLGDMVKNRILAQALKDS